MSLSLKEKIELLRKRRIRNALIEAECESLSIPQRGLSYSRTRENAIKSGMNMWSAGSVAIDTTFGPTNNELLNAVARFFERPEKFTRKCWYKFCWYELKDTALMAAGQIADVHDEITVAIRNGKIVLDENGIRYYFCNNKNRYEMTKEPNDSPFEFGVSALMALASGE